MSTEDMGGPMSRAELAGFRARAKDTAYQWTPEHEEANRLFGERCLREERERLQAIMEKPIVGFLHRLFNTSAYREYLSHKVAEWRQ